jgi:hypothetical protein
MVLAPLRLPAERCVNVQTGPSLSDDQERTASRSPPALETNNPRFRHDDGCTPVDKTRQANMTNLSVLRMSLNRSQCGSCSTKYDTLTGT